MKCQLCGMEYKESEGVKACKGCPLSRNCGKLKCPRCGYENPVEPSIFKIFRKKAS